MKHGFLKCFLLTVALFIGVSVSAQQIYPLWTVPADAETGLCSSRVVSGFGDVVYGANNSAGTIEEWKNGALVASYDVNSFCVNNQLGEMVDQKDEAGNVTGQAFQAYTLWTAVMVDDAGNILANVGLGTGSATTCQNWVLLPASNRNAMQLLHIDEFPSADVALGRVDIPSRIVGDIAGDGAYLYVAPNGSAMMAVMFVGLDNDGKIYYDTTKSKVFNSSIAFDNDTNVATFQTFDNILNATEDGEVAAKTYVRWRVQSSPFTWDATAGQFVMNTAVPQGAGTPGMDVFKIGDVEYIVVPVKSATTGMRGASVAVYNLADGTEVASWDSGCSSEYYVGSVQARVNEDGKSAYIYVCGQRDCIGLLMFDPQGTQNRVVTACSLNQTEVKMSKTQEVQLTSSITLVEGAEMPYLYWSSSDYSVVNVDQTGKITAVSPGTATITLKVYDASALSASCKVSVCDYDIESGSLYYNTTSSIEPNTAELTAGAYSGAIVIPETVTYDEIVYNVTSINSIAFNGCNQLESVTIPENVVTISDNSFVGCDNLLSIMMKSATPPVVYNTSFSTYAYLGATLYVPSGSVEAYKEATGWKNFVNIEEYASIATGIEIESAKTLEVGAVSKIIVKTVPENALSPTLTWSTNNESVATVSKDGVVTAIGAGTAVITAIGETGITATCAVTVVDKGDNYMVADDMVVEKGTSFTLPIEMANANEITAFQCDVYLPEGATVATIEDEYDISLSARGTSSHVIMSSLQDDGSIRIVSYSTKSEAYTGNEGTIFGMNLSITSDCNGGDVSVKNIILSTPSGTGYTCPDFSFNLDGYGVGDANDDGIVNVIDVVNTANYILGNTASNFMFLAADVTGDGEVNIVDIVNLTNIILNGTTTSSTLSLQSAAVRRVLQGETEENRIYIDDFSIAAGEELEVAIKMNNSVAFTAFEFNIYIPEGLSVYQEDGEYIFDLSDRKTRSHTIASALQDDGSIKVLSYSTNSKNFSGNSGDLVYFTIIADADYSGMSQIEIKNIILSTNGSETESGDAVGYYPSDVITVVTDKNDTQSGVEYIWSEEDAPAEYYNLQGVRVVNPEKGVYIKRQGGKTTKVVL